MTSHPSSNLVVKGPRTLAARKAYDEPLDVSIRRIENERFRGLMIHPYSRPASSHSPVPMTSEAPSGVVAVTPQDAPINLEVPKQSGGDNWRYITPPRQQVINNGELTIVQHARAPSPPQDEPVDFSTKSKSTLSLNVKSAFNKSRHGSTSSSSAGSSVSPLGADNHLKSFTSSRELKFAKNLKCLLVEILRKNPTKAKIIIRYMQHVWWKKNGGNGATGRYLDLSKSSSDGIRHCTAANGQPGSGQYVQGGNNSSNGGGGSSSGGAGAGGQGGPSGSNGGGYGSGSGGSNGGGNGNNGNNRRPFGFGGNGGSNNNNNNNEDEKESNEPNKSGNNPNNNSINSVGGAGGVVGGNSILDIGDLDFDDLPTPTVSSTANWFTNHPEINTGKVINGLLNLKSEYPSQNGSMGGNGNGVVNLEKMNANDLTGLDNATANLLQMSVPDPSTTFLDIGTDIGGCASLYEDDPFNLEHLLPSNFNMNQLDVLSGNGNNSRNGSMLNSMPHGPHENSVTLTSKNIFGEGSNLQPMAQQQPQELTAISPNHSSPMSNANGLTITATSITTNTQNSLSSAQQHQSQNLPSSICASLYPETTISPVMGHRQNNQIGTVQQNPSHNLSGHQQQSAGLNMNANHLRNLEPIPPSSLKTFIKTEPQPINLPQQPGVNQGHLHQQQHDMHPLQYIKKENNLEMQPPQHQAMNNQYLSPLNPEIHSTSSRPDMYDRTPGVSPTSMPSPGSPPISTSYKNMGAQGVAAMAIAALANGAPPGHPSLPDRFHFTPQMMMQGLQSPSMPSPSPGPSAGPSGIGGGKMRGPPGPGGNRKRSSSSQCKDGDDDLSSVPSLQMRIKILQQRVSCRIIKVLLK